MKKWYIVKCGAKVDEITFEDENKAKQYAHRITCESGEVWRAEMVVGWDA